MDEKKVDLAMLAQFIPFTALCLNALEMGFLTFPGCIGPLGECDGSHESSYHTHTPTFAHILQTVTATVALVRGPQVKDSTKSETSRRHCVPQQTLRLKIQASKLKRSHSPWSLGGGAKSEKRRKSREYVTDIK